MSLWSVGPRAESGPRIRLRARYAPQSPRLIHDDDALSTAVALFELL